MNTAHYFSHDSNARNDQKILILRSEYGWEGYGVFFAMLEIMFDNDDTCIQVKALKAIALTLNIDYQHLQNIIDLCIEEGLLQKDEKTIWSNGLRVRKERFLEITRKRSEAGKIGMRNRWGKQQKDNAVITPLKQSNNDDITIKLKETKENTILVEKVVEYLNKKAGTAYRSKSAVTIKNVIARKSEGYGYEDFTKVIDHKCKEWMGTEYAKFLRPETLFGNKFEGYYNTAKITATNGTESKLKFKN